ncbi:MAG: methyltransferase domain-containing protein, partial [Candidatus Peribacteraceae bacterium]|nr:methyltransferase domain-containing protein [Candidatus Peribacteraceae bacterium]
SLKKAIDINPQDKDVIKSSADDMPFQDNQFDTVFCTEVLEHIPTNGIRPMLKEIKRVLMDGYVDRKNSSSGGNLIITVPYDEDLSRKTMTCPYCNSTYHGIGHVQSFDLVRITGLLEDNGFKVVDYHILPIMMMSRFPMPYRYKWVFRLLSKHMVFEQKLIIICRPVG